MANNLDQRIIDEIKRKVHSGEQLTNPTAQKDALYRQFQGQMEREVARKAQGSMPLSNPTPYKNDLYSRFANGGMGGGDAFSWLQNQMQMGQMGNQSQLDAMMRMLQGSADSMFAQQQSMLGNALQQQIANLERAYNDAVAQGEMSVREANEAFEANKKEVERQAYLDSQQTQLVAQDRGIQNSQQMLGLMSADDQVKNSMLNENMTTRDRRVADIQDRIRAIGQQKNLDLALARSQYDYGLANARSQADQMMFNNMFQLQQQDYMMNREQQWQGQMAQFQNLTQLEHMARQHNLDLAKMDKAQQLELAKMAVQNGYNIDLTKLNHELDLVKMGQQHQYNLSTIDAQGNWDLRKMAQQHGYNMSEISARQRSELQMLEQRAKMQAQQAEKDYNLAMKRELSKYTPGTPEYKIMQNQLQQQKQAMQMEIHTRAQMEANAIFAQQLPTQMPQAPAYSLWDRITGGASNKDADYQNALSQWLQRMDWDDDGLFNNSYNFNRHQYSSIR